MSLEFDAEGFAPYTSNHDPNIRFTLQISSNEVHGSLSLGSQSTSRYHGQLQPLLWGAVSGQALIGFAFVRRSKQYLL